MFFGMYNTAVVRKFSLGFDLMVVANEPLELGMLQCKSYP